MIFACVKCANTKNTNTKYTNTQIKHTTKCQKDPTCGIFLKRGLFKDLKNYIPKCLIQKYTNTNSQIHKYTNTAYEEVPERPNMWYIFEKRIIQGYQKLYFHVSNTHIQKYKYTNTAYDKVPEMPNLWYIFEKRIVQGYQKLCFHVLV